MIMHFDWISKLLLVIAAILALYCVVHHIAPF
jgi:fumarate reductase subunit D